ncbi:MAG: oligosaccharide flippase family protein [Candidatus Latescibacteria bacterium]|nr:oligosaccharide flippase family protein [Candidatus Latescibacterota bacterium]
MNSIFRKQIKDITIYVGTNAFIQFIGLLVVPFFWKELNPEDYGIIGITDIVSMFFGPIISLSFEQNVNKHYFVWKNEERKGGIGTIWLLSWVNIVIFGSIVLFLLWKTSHFLFPKVDFYPFVFLATLSMIIGSFGQIAFMTIRIKALAFLYSIFILAFFGSQIGLRIYFVLFLKKGLFGYYQASLIASVFYAVMSFVVMAYFTCFKFSFRNIKDYIRFSLPIVPHSMLGSLSGLMDKFLLQRFATLETMGIYSLSLRFASIIGSLHDAMKLSFGPFSWKCIAKGDEGKKEMTNVTPLYLAPYVIIAIILSLFTENILELIGRKQYLPIAEYVPFLTGVVLIGCLYVYFSPGMMLSGRTEFLWIPSAFQLVSIVCFSWLLIPSFQIYGVIISKYAAAIIFFSISFFYSQKMLPLPHQWKKAYSFGILLISANVISKFIPSSPIWLNASAKCLLLVMCIFTMVMVVSNFNLRSNKLRDFICRLK